MSTIQPKDRVRLCTFTFSDGRRCRTPRQSGHPMFCCFHARKHRQSHAADQLGSDFLFLLSGGHISACDLAAALSRFFAGVTRGDIKPRTASTLAYLAQTLLLTIEIAEKEYTDAFGAQALRKVVRTRVRENQEYFNKGSAQPVAQPGSADLQIGVPAPASNSAPQPPMPALSSADSSLASPASPPAVNSQPTPHAAQTSTTQAPASRVVQAPTAQAPVAHVATGPSVASLLASPPVPMPPKSLSSHPRITPLKSTLTKVIENK